ncbi:hypothetical protein DMENIID0001_134960 [Sergentomyia squamirostris]
MSTNELSATSEQLISRFEEIADSFGDNAPLDFIFGDAIMEVKCGNERKELPFDDSARGMLLKKALERSVGNFETTINGLRLIRCFEDYVTLHAVTSDIPVIGVPKDFDYPGKFNFELFLTKALDNKFQACYFVNGKLLKGGTNISHLKKHIIIQLRESGITEEEDDIFDSIWMFVSVKMQSPEITDDGIVSTRVEDGSHNGGVIKHLASVWKKFYTAKIDTDSKDYRKHVHDAQNVNKDGEHCILWVVEGISAKDKLMGHVAEDPNMGILAVEGMLTSVVSGPLSGKHLENKRIQYLFNVLGIRNDITKPRYQTIRILFDHDDEGTWNKWLLIRLLNERSPDIFQYISIEVFRLPIVVAHKAGEPTRMFFSRQDYESNATMLDGYKIFDEMRSFPTHSSWIRRLYFASMDDHRVKIRCQEFEEESCDDAELESEISAEDFGQRFDVNGFSLTEYYKNEILPAKMRLRRKHFLDLRIGLKNASGMVVYTGMKCIGAQVSRLDFNGRLKVEVAYLSRNITDVLSTMINTDIGIQNAPLLRDPSCYGARVLSKRPSHSSYDQVKVMRSTRLLYPKEDNAYLEHDFTKQSCKLKRFKGIPVLPIPLLNSTRGGFTQRSYTEATLIYDITDVVNNIERMHRGINPERLIPFFENFSGNVYELKRKGMFLTVGVIYYHMNPNTVQITALPISLSRKSFGRRLNKLKRAGAILTQRSSSEFSEYFYATIKFSSSQFKRLEKQNNGFFQLFGLCRKLRETQMIFLDEEQKKRSLTHLQYTEEHYNMRSALYKKRDPINWKTIWRKDILKYQEALREEISEGKISVPTQYERVLRQKIRYNLTI